jgi:hypothetical protein
MYMIYRARDRVAQKNVQAGTARPMDIDNHDTDNEDGGGIF